MWTKPGYVPTESQQQAPPEDTGQRLATIARGKDEELRLSLAEFEGKPFISVRVWAQNRDGAFWPVAKKGCSIRIRELDAVIEALSDARRILDEEAAPRRRDGR